MALAGSVELYNSAVARGPHPLSYCAWWGVLGVASVAPAVGRAAVPACTRNKTAVRLAGQLSAGHRGPGT